MKQLLKQFTLRILVVLLFLFPFSPAKAQSSRSISVSGEAQVNVVPDQVILTLGIETWDKVLKTAKADNDTRVARILAVAKKYDVPAEKVKTDYITIEPRYQNGYTQSDFIGFFVRKNIVITLNDISKFEDLLSDSLDAGANFVHGIQFRTTELRKYRDHAREAAIKAAKEKAAALAGAIGLKIGKATAISEDSFGWWYYGGWWGSMGGGAQSQNVMQNAPSSGSPTGDDNTLAPGQIAVTARVSLVFELVE